MKSLRAYSDPAASVYSEPVRLARLLSLTVTKDFDEVVLARKVAKGLPPRSVTALIEALDLDDSEIIGPVVPRSTLQKRKRAGTPLSREHSERFYWLGRVIDALGQAYLGDRGEIKGFLSRPHPMLHGDTPFDLARSGSAGAEAVLSLLHSAEASVAV
jgi:putative toxin-antitoxin system antitoxin component (TIGR02293 family)